MTLNLWNRMGPWDDRAVLIRRYIERFEPDIIGLQEVLRGPGFDQLSELFGGTGYVHEFAVEQPFRGDASLEIGNAVASRWPLEDRAELTLPHASDGEVRTALMVTVATPSGAVSFTNSHLNWRREHGEVRERQVVAIAEWISENGPAGGFPPILVGDFNAEPESAEIRYLTGLQSLGGSTYFRDAWRYAGRGDGMTWSNRNPYAVAALDPDIRIDYIFVGPPQPTGVGDVESCLVVCDEPTDGVWPSDHFGVFAVLRTEPLRDGVPS